MNEWKTQKIKESLYPNSVAVLGVSDAPANLGKLVVDVLGLEGFPGKIFPVHPRLNELLGHKVYSSIEDIEEPVDLVICGLNAKITSEVIIESCAKKGVKGIVCLGGGFKEVGEDGAKYEQRLKEVADRNEIIIFGPNILGVINNEHRLYATFWSFKKGNPAGPVTLVSQSGGTACIMFNTLIDKEIGVNKWICLGNRTNLEFADILYYLEQDEGTKVIALFVEGTDDARSLVEAAKQVGTKKPVVLLKGARTKTMNQVAHSHTGTLAGEYGIFSDACRQNGILEVTSSEDMANVCKALALVPSVSGDKVAVLTHTAGPSILAMDALIQYNCPVAQVSDDTLKKLRGIIGEKIPVILSPNPVDITGSCVFVEPYSKSVEAVLQDDGVDILIAVYAIHREIETSAKALVEIKKRTNKILIVCILSSMEEMIEDERILREAGIPVYQLPEDAALAASYIIKYSRRKV